MKMTILKGIPRIIPPRLLYVLASMGHGDEIVLADANFPAASVAKAGDSELICCDSLTVPELLEAICRLMPLETYAKFAAAVMQVTPQDVGKVATPVWQEYVRILKEAEGNRISATGDGWLCLEKVERFAFYERAKKAYAVVSTGESALYGNLILKKGILGPNDA